MFFLFWNPSKVDAVRYKGQKLSGMEGCGCVRILPAAENVTTRYLRYGKKKKKKKSKWALTLRTGAHDSVHIQNLYVALCSYFYYHSTAEHLHLPVHALKHTLCDSDRFAMHSLSRLWVCRKHFRLPLGVPPGSIHNALMSLWQRTDLHSEADRGLGRDVRLVWTLCCF